MPEPNDKLFLLISRLTASEKGYVNKHLKLSNSNSNLLQLYLFICKIKPHEEYELKQKIGENYLLKNLAVTKKQLFDRILKILRDYHANKGELRIVLAMFEDIVFLFERGMVDECEKMLKKAVKICDDYEMYGLKLHLLEWEKRILNVYYYNKSYEEKINLLRATSKKTIEKFTLVNNMDLKQLEFYSNILEKKWDDDKKDLTPKIEELNLYLKSFGDSNDLGNSNRLKITISNLLARTTYFKNGVDEAFKILNGESLRVSDKLNPLSLESYQEILLRKIGFASKKHDKENFEAIIKELDKVHAQFPVLKKHRNADMIVICYQIQYMCMEGGQFDQKKADALDRFLYVNAEKIPHGAWMCFHLARYYFYHGMYELALSLNIKALSQPKQYVKYYEYICRFFSVMILLELQRYNSVNRAIQELKRYLKKEEQATHFEKTIVAFFKKAESHWERPGEITLFKEFEHMTADLKEELSFNLYYLEIEVWLKASEKKMTIAAYKRSQIV